MKTSDIHIRDSFVLPLAEDGWYYLYGTTDDDPWKAPATGFDAYRSKDLLDWEGPFPVFRPESDFWADRNFWAPEVHRFHGDYFMFASFKSEDRPRGTQVLRSSSPLGPFRPLAPEPLTPSDWECLDGTPFIDGGGQAYLVFCHEWVQVRDGEICAIPVSSDFSKVEGPPQLLFRASEAPWSVPHSRPGWTLEPTDCVTDGPFLYRSNQGDLLMIWSSFTTSGYAAGVARSESGTITGPWTQQNEPLVAQDVGHAMLFRTFQGQLTLAAHGPNRTPDERPIFLPVEEEGGILRLLR